MAHSLIAVVDDTTEFHTTIDSALHAAGYAVMHGGWNSDTYADIKHQQPALVILHVTTDETPQVPINDHLRDNNETHAIPVLLCSDNSLLLPGVTKLQAQTGCVVQASSCMADEVLTKVGMLVKASREVG